MNICGLVVHARPEQAPVVAGRLAALPGVDVHGEADGRLVVTVEDAGEVPAADTLAAIGGVTGVLSTVLIYHYGGEDLEQTLSEEEHP
jgi:nitrate reductase NapD